MTTNIWVGPGPSSPNPNFGTAGSSDSNWSLGHVPNSTEDVVVNIASAFGLDATTNQTVGTISLGTNDNLNILNSNFSAINGSGFNEGSIDVEGGDLTLGNGSSPETFDNAGSVNLGVNDANATSKLLISGTVNLTGSGQIFFLEGQNSIEGVGGGTLVNESETIHGDGTIGGGLSFTNDGTILSAGGERLVIEGSAGLGSFTNTIDGQVTIDDNGTLTLGVDGVTGGITNNGPISMSSTGDATEMAIAGNETITASSTAAGEIVMGGADVAENGIVSDGKPATLTLVNQTLKGAGTVGDANLTLNIGAGTTVEAPAGTLLLDTGSNTITCSGLIDAGNGETIDIGSPISNTGTILVESGTINATAVITSSTPVQIDGGTFDLASGGMLGGNVEFTGIRSTLEIDTGVNQLNGVISGAQESDAIDFHFLAFNAGDVAVWQQTTSTAGILSIANSVGQVISGTSIVLDGQYASSDFRIGSDGSTGTQIDVPNPLPPAGTTADMIMDQNSTGEYEIYDIGQNAILSGFLLDRRIFTSLAVVGLGAFDASDTSDMLLRDGSTGQFQVYDISNNNITNVVSLGTVGLEWQVSGFGDFSGRAGETDMLMRDTGTGQFEIYDISNNAITSAASMGQVGLEWSVAGFGDFSTRPNETDMLMRNTNTGAFEIFDIGNNQLTSAAPMGQVGLEWSVAGFGDFSGHANETDMLMRDTNTGAFEIYDISNNQLTSFASMGQVGLEWSVAGFGPIDGVGSSDMLMRDTSNGAFEVFDISNNQLTTAAPMGQVGTDWSVAGIAADPPANAQLTQAMASVASASEPIATSAPLSQAATQSPIVSPLAAPNGQVS